MVTNGVYAGLVPGCHPAHHIGGLFSASPTVPTDQSCPTNQIVDAITLTCAPICADDSRPVNGKCVGYAGPPKGPGYMIFMGHAIPKWAVYGAAGIAVLALGFGGWKLLHPKSLKAAAKAASYYMR